MRKFLLFSMLALSVLAFASEVKTVDFSPDVGISQEYITSNDFNEIQISAGVVSVAPEFTISNSYQISQDWALSCESSDNFEEYWEYIVSDRQIIQVSRLLEMSYSINAPPNAVNELAFEDPGYSQTTNF